MEILIISKIQLIDNVGASLLHIIKFSILCDINDRLYVLTDIIFSLIYINRL